MLSYPESLLKSSGRASNGGFLTLTAVFPATPVVGNAGRWGLPIRTSIWMAGFLGFCVSGRSIQDIWYGGSVLVSRVSRIEVTIRATLQPPG